MPELPDFRDFSIETDEVHSIFEAVTMKINPIATQGKKSKNEEIPLAIPAQVDVRNWCSPIENQGQIGSCTAHAGVGLLEYYQRRAYGIHLDASRLFLYKVTRNLLKWTGDTGAYLRTTMKAMAAFGVCPEEYWLYSDTKTRANDISTDPFEKKTATGTTPQSNPSTTGPFPPIDLTGRGGDRLYRFRQNTNVMLRKRSS